MTPATNKEWNLLKQQFDELVHDESAAADSIEKIFDAEFHRRFGELINRTRAGTSPRRLANEPTRLGTFGQTTLRI